MHGKRFDDFVKQIGTARLTRVRVIRGFAAAAVAALSDAVIEADQTVSAQDGTCTAEGDICEVGGGEPCCLGECICPGMACNQRDNPARCRACGGSGQFCCTMTTPCIVPGETCLPNGTCGVAQGDGGDGGTVPPPSGGGAGIVIFLPPSGCTSDAQCTLVAPFCDVANGRCFSIGIRCKSGDSPQRCCRRAVEKGCNRKQQSHHAKKKCLKKGKQTCNRLLAGLV